MSLRFDMILHYVKCKIISNLRKEMLILNYSGSHFKDPNAIFDEGT